MLQGDSDGSTAFSTIADINEIPAFARAGSVIPTIPVRSGNTIGLARQQYDHIIWSVYLLANGWPKSGSGRVYEDDGITTKYVAGSFAETTASYRIVTVDLATAGDGSSEYISLIHFNVSTTGGYDELPSTRATSVRFINTLPPLSVTVGGKELKFSRFGGEGTWSYDSQAAALVIELPVSSVSDGFDMNVKVPTSEHASMLNGIGFRISRALAAKATLDEIRLVPGSQTGQASSTAYLLQAASMGSTLEAVADDPKRFMETVLSFEGLLKVSIRELYTLLDEHSCNDKNVRSSRLLSVQDAPNPKICNRISRALTLVADGVRYN